MERKKIRYAVDRTYLHKMTPATGELVEDTYSQIKRSACVNKKEPWRLPSSHHPTANVQYTFKQSAIGSLKKVGSMGNILQLPSNRTQRRKSPGAIEDHRKDDTIGELADVTRVRSHQSFCAQNTGPACSKELKSSNKLKELTGFSQEERLQNLCRKYLYDPNAAEGHTRTRFLKKISKEVSDRSNVCLMVYLCCLVVVLVWLCCVVATSTNACLAVICHHFLSLSHTHTQMLSPHETTFTRYVFFVSNCKQYSRFDRS